ncbi:MAG: phenylalanine--tRNA ligase subunit beta, partial [bacterium]
LGMARELAAQFRLKLKKPDFEAPLEDQTADGQFPAEIIIENADLCPRYAGRVITDLTIAESPAWLKRRLEAVGQRPINNIVDITNYVLFAVGHPLHAFDYETLSERQIRVREARTGEKIVTLDGVARELDPSMLAICDSQRPVAVAGIMGGAESEISGSTRTMLLESAYFEPSSIRRTSKRLGLTTEASYRFERGADPGLPVNALNLACRLIEEVGVGRCVSPVIDINPLPFQPRRIEIRERRIEQVLGVAVPLDEAAEILESLDFKVRNSAEGSRFCEIPSFRGDVELEDDIVEEVARHYGYDRIPSHYPASETVGHFTETEYHDRRLLDELVGFGFLEAVNYTFTTPSREELFLGRAPEMIAIANPLSEMGTHLRTSLLPGLVEALRYNLNHGNRDVRLFEMGSIYLTEKESGEEKIVEPRRLALAVCGSFYNPYWSRIQDPFTFQHLKGLIQSLWERVGHPVNVRKVAELSYLHPGFSAEVIDGDKRVGLFGELHPRLLESYKFA